MAGVLNTSFLIALAKIGKLELLEHLSGAKLVPEGVRKELQAGRRHRQPEATQILELLRRLAVQVKAAQPHLKAPSVDEEILTLARGKKAAVFF